MSTVYRSKAPLRIGLAGGGTDVSPYSDRYGGAILNATISLSAHANIELIPEHRVEIFAMDRGETFISDTNLELATGGGLDLLKGVHNRIRRDFGMPDTGYRLTTYVDAPPGSGLGTSSTLVVAVIGAFAEWLKLPLGEYDIAHLAYQIEREDLKMAGGRQDQYAATFGGVNFMEFFQDDKVIVNPLRVRESYMHELTNNLLLFYTETSRNSSDIIASQVKNVEDNKEESLQAMHHLKEQAVLMKEALLRGKLSEIGEILDFGWKHKKNMTKGISNPMIEEVYEAAKKAGATGGKISGAGGGGFMTFYCPGTKRYAVTEAVEAFGGTVKNYNFTRKGLITWSI